MYCRLGPPQRHEREPEQDLHVELDLLLWCSCQYVIKLQGKQSVNIYLHLPVRTVYISGGKGDILVRVCRTVSKNMEKCKKLIKIPKWN